MSYAEVAVDSGRPHRGTFTYALPAHERVRVGHAVVVPFGRQVVQGIVLALSSATAVATPRPIVGLLDADPVITVEQAGLARWIAEFYLAPLFSAVALFLSPGFERRPQRLLEAAPLTDAASLSGLAPRERRLLDLIASRGPIEARQLDGAFGGGKTAPAVRALIKQSLVEERYALSRPRVRERRETILALVGDAEATRAAIEGWPRSRRSSRADLLERLLEGALERGAARRLAGSRASLERWLGQGGLIAAAADDSPVRLSVDRATATAAIASLRRSAAERRQVALLRTLLDGPCEAISARQVAGAEPADVETLVEAGLVRRETRRRERDPLAGRQAPRVDAPRLTADQAVAYRRVAAALDAAAAARRAGRREPRLLLLHGVTGSGKTEVYLAAVEHAITQGGRAIVLVPEISLTPQTLDRFLARLPGRVGVLHSGLSVGERQDQWERIREGRVDVVIGSRSALFAPLPDLHLVIMDEEHEWTYKQTDPAPRYGTRDVLEEYCRRLGIVALLGSATPDVTTTARAAAGRYERISLPQRVRRAEPADPNSPVQPAPLPAVDVVDMRDELTSGNRSIFSRALASAIEETLARHEQLMLFINRRGAFSFVCRACGEALICDRCDVPYTYHETVRMLRCHECGLTARPVHICPACGEDRLRPMGIGTQRLEAEVAKQFPLARPLRWDRDTVVGRDGHRRLLERFVGGEANVLVGTQMIAKGLDLPAVTLVGVVNADLSLRLPDYTGPERTFQLLTQVAGRAGRGPSGGRVIVQSYAPDHYAVRAAAAHDYDSFYEQEMEARARHDYPPYGRLARLVVADRRWERARDLARTMAASLIEDRDRRGLPGPEVLGPTPAYLYRRRNLFRWQITLRGADPLPLLRPIDFGRGWSVDLDPVSLL